MILRRQSSLTQPPPLGTAVDMRNPRAHKLGAAWFPAMGRTGAKLPEITGHYPPSTNPAPWATTERGPALHWDYATSTPVTLPLLPFGPTGTLIATFRFADFTVSHRLFGSNNDGTHTLELAGAYCSGGNTTLYFGWYNAAEYRVTGAAAAVFGISAGVFATVAMSWNVATTSTIVYVNGIRKAAKTNGLTVFTPTVAPTLSHPTGWPMAGDMSRFLWYDRELSAAEVMRDYAEPYGVFQSGDTFADGGSAVPTILQLMESEQ